MISAKAAHRTFHVKCGARQGTCFSIDVEDHQYLVTATHLLRGLASGALVQILHGRKWKPLDIAIVGQSPPQIDVTVLALKFRMSRPEVTLEPSMAGLAEGQEAYCLGFPLAPLELLFFAVKRANPTVPPRVGVPRLPRICVPPHERRPTRLRFSH